jgi:hypothetical protein
MYSIRYQDNICGKPIGNLEEDTDPQGFLGYCFPECLGLADAKKEVRDGRK